MKIVVGSTNRAKLSAAQIAINSIFSGVKVESIDVASGVSNQPKSDAETIKGAINRAKRALEKTQADFSIGMEGGINKIGKQWFECGWIAVVDKTGKVGLGSSGRFEISEKFVRELLEGRELRDLIIEITGNADVYQEGGAMGMITNGTLPRDLAYSHGVIFAFSRFFSKINLVDQT